MCERMIAKYEEELCPTKEEKERQHQLLDAVFKKHQVVLHRTDIQQPPHIKEEEEDPQPPHIKEEEEEVWITQEGECLLGQEEDDVSKFPLTVVSVKTEEHEDKPPESSQLHHSPIVQTHSVTPVIHSLKYFITASSQVPNFPEYVSVGYVDEVEISYYDNNIRKAESKQDWMNKITAEDPNYWQIQTEKNVVNEHIYKVNIEKVMKRFNQTGGVHTFQMMSGCEWNDETDEVQGWYQISYDGEDFISLDMKTWTWTAAKQQAFPSKLKLDQEIRQLDYFKYYFTERCPSYLKKYVEYGKKVLMRTELPEVFLLQKTPSSPVSCMATGFYPDRADLFWRKDGEQIFEDVEHGELLPNPDGTFQMSVELKVEVTAEVEGKYECVFHLSGVEEDLVTKLERRSILSNASHEGNVSLTATLAVLAVVVLLIIIIIFIIKRRRSRQAKYDPAAGDAGNELSERREG
ncbi:major histocompatibility complex class I-related gene protein-like isoform X2 [Nerophis lumbriciformis]|uniref:major histocompatibility complex class I-related gene protein-like isoform X2 n=1 Tax=Nerophis lumbriciformis TaxID=546530 RepID=UPI002ADFBEF1|nr:major histocompatibility complex class I-related gene protein-like isoform X3 [Nerophis lumbriciformis]XP_061784466.1 major histocompatibility complex class I-related gene protein-like isoform X3 [Nerophis lumbriciformis]